MVAHVATISLSGINAVAVDVQAQITSGLPAFNIVGLPDNSVKESKERVRGAFYSMGISLPGKRITINLAPADLSKAGSHYDLPIAIGLLIVLKILPQDAADDAIFMGELSLDGTLTAVTGSLPAAIHGLQKGCSSLFVPKVNANEAVWAEGINVYGINNLSELIKHLKGEEVIARTKPEDSNNSSDDMAIAQNGTNPKNANRSHKAKNGTSACMGDVRGQESVKRAAEIAMAGGHNILMSGCPGSGKSMIAKRMVGLSPKLTSAEALEVSMIHSVAGMLGVEGLVKERPFRDPHHSASAVALCGGGLRAQPGEMSLAHRGVLFLDELPEFPRQVLETLRQPLEGGTITVSRANHHVTYPANFQLIAAMNPCPCGYDGHPSVACSCSKFQVQNYKNRISGPLMDRIDIHIDVPAVDMKKLTAIKGDGESSVVIQARIEKAQKIQRLRFKDSEFSNNAEMIGQILDESATPDEEGLKMLELAGDKFAFSARSYHRILRVARTIADLAGEQKVQRPHIVEALGYRYDASR